MITNLIAYLSDIFTSKRCYDNLDAYITSGNPKTAEDVEILEREFYEHRRNDSFTFFHE